MMAGDQHDTEVSPPGNQPGPTRLHAHRVVLDVDGLDEPPVGAGCCALHPEDLLIDELDSWPGLLPLTVDPETGTAELLVQPGCAHLPDALEALRDRGLPAKVLSDQPVD